ncbi:MAG: zinc metalloprotease HtpX, partial [Alphaproteobacteria bacterium]|nr:zinc metalloprotease HtpX [Alphaproteobacteria bacterium]
VLSFITPRFGPEIVLRLYKARPIARQELPELFGVIDTLSKRADLPVAPNLYYVGSSNMNAFAVGRPEASVITVTDGLLRGLNMRQLIGVIAHEISHIANEDLKVMGLADVVSRITGLMQSIGFFLLFIGIWQGGSAVIAALVLILAPMIGTLLQLALSRSREYDADLGAARLTGDPAGLASALRALQRKQGGLWESIFIPGGRVPDPSLMRTHPNVEDRVARLLELTPEAYPELEAPPEAVLVVPAAFRPVFLPPRYHVSGLWY